MSLALDFALHIQRPDGMTPSFSDGDIVDFRGLLALGAELLDRDDLRWVATGGEAGAPPTCVDATFPVGGYLTARSGWGDGATAYGDERFMLMDAGPIGDGGHGHYDQLSIELYADGRSLVVDPGRYTYADTSWRHWFKGSAAHNTVTVDGLDQTPYRHAAPKTATSQARLVRRVSRRRLRRHRGRGHQPAARGRAHPPRAVSRTRVLGRARPSPRRHGPSLRGSLAPARRGRRTRDRRARLRIRRRSPLLPAASSMPASPTVEIEPGWVSPSYGIKQPAPIVVVRAEGTEADIVTVLSPGDAVVTLDDQHRTRVAAMLSSTRDSTTDLIRVGGAHGRCVGKAEFMTMATASPPVGFATDPAIPATGSAARSRQRRRATQPHLALRHARSSRARLRRVKYRIGESLRVVYDVVADGRRFVMSARTFANSADVFRKRRVERRARPRHARCRSRSAHRARCGGRCRTIASCATSARCSIRRYASAAAVVWRGSSRSSSNTRRRSRRRCASSIAHGQVSGFAKAYLDRDALDVANQYNRIAASIALLDGIRTPRALGWARPDRIVVLEPMRGRPWTQLPAEIQPTAMQQLRRGARQHPRPAHRLRSRSVPALPAGTGAQQRRPGGHRSTRRRRRARATARPAGRRSAGTGRDRLPARRRARQQRAVPRRRGAHDRLRPGRLRCCRGRHRQHAGARC